MTPSCSLGFDSLLFQHINYLNCYSCFKLIHFLFIVYKQYHMLDNKKTKKVIRSKYDKIEGKYFDSFALVFQRHLRALPQLLFQTIETSELMEFDKNQFESAGISSKLKALSIYQMGISEIEKQKQKHKDTIQQNKMKIEKKQRQIEKLRKKTEQKQGNVNEKVKEYKRYQTQMISRNYQRYKQRICPYDNPLQFLYNWIHSQQFVNLKNGRNQELKLETVVQQKSRMNIQQSIKILESKISLNNISEQQENNEIKKIISDKLEEQYQIKFKITQSQQEHKVTQSYILSSQNNSINQSRKRSITQTNSHFKPTNSFYMAQQQQTQLQNQQQKIQSHQQSHQISEDNKTQIYQVNEQHQLAHNYRIRKIPTGKKGARRRISFPQRTPIVGRKDIFH